MQNAYVVMVNNKYMMRVQAESKCGAEHVVLDRFSDEINKYHVITSAQAFDSDDLKTTWFFRDYFSRCDLISMRWLEELVEDYVRTMQDMEDMQSLLREATKMAEAKEAELEPEASFPGCSKLPFGYFTVPIGNTADSRSPLGASTFSRAIPQLHRSDKLFGQIGWEYESKETAVHIASSLLRHNQTTDQDEYPGGKDRSYRAIDYDIGLAEKPLLDVFSPQIRDSAYFNAWNQLMRQIEFNCFLAYGTLSDPNNTDKTAEEIKSSKQRSYSYVSSCQMALQHALEDLVDAMAFWCQVYGTAPAGELHMHFDWDDSILVDKEQERQTARADIAMGAMSVIEYRMRYYGETEEEATAAIAKISTSDDGVMK